MNRTVALIALTLGTIATISSAPDELCAQVIRKEGKTPADFLPAKWTLKATVSGDLNGDAYADVVAIMDSPIENRRIEGSSTTIPLPGRWVVILEGTNSGKLRLAAQSANVARCSECGGVYGDPFLPPSIANKVLTVSNYGGSAWRWSDVYKIAIYHGQYQLIGFTHGSFHAADPCTTTGIDYNTVTGAARLTRKVSSGGGCKDEEQWVKIKPKSGFSLDVDWKLPNQTDFQNFFEH